MRRIVISAAFLAAAALLASSPALALHNQPYKGKNFKVNLATSYNECTAPDTVTDDAVPACSTLSRTDPSCGFAGGQGKVQLKSLTVGNQAFRIKMNGLDIACNGQTLNFFITYRKTGNLCGGGLVSCTTGNVLQQLGSCAVSANGICKTNGAIFLPGGAAVGQIEILEVHAERLGLRSFSTGMIIRKP